MAPLDRTAYLQIEDVTLLEAINALQASSGVSLAFSPDLLPIDRRMTCDCEELSVRAVLDRILEDTGLRYVEAGRRILIHRIGDVDNGNHPPPLPPGATGSGSPPSATTRPPSPSLWPKAPERA